MKAKLPTPFLLPLLFFLISSLSPSLSFAHCQEQKKSFLENLVKSDVGEQISFGLPPEGVHDVIKAIPSKELGQWFELRYSKGSLEQIRKVGPLKTDISSWSYSNDSCVMKTELISRSIHEKFSGFSDTDLKQLLAETHNGVIYTISPAHPLSESALPGILDNAKKYNLEVTLLTDSTINDEEMSKLKSKYPTLRKIESLELIYRGMFNHFPSTLVYQNGKIVGRPLLGARAPVEIDRAFNHFLNESYEETPLSELTKIDQSPTFGSFSQYSSSELGYKIVKKFNFPPMMNVKFIHTMPNPHQILIFIMGKTKTVHLYDITTEKIIRTWENTTSPYPSADGKLIVTMDDSFRIQFQEPGKAEPFFTGGPNAWYPAVSVLKESEGKTYYRVITRMMDMKIQDYAIDYNHETPVVTRIGEEHRVCTNLATNATPYISRFDGDKFTLIQEDNSRQIVKLHEDGTCTYLTKLGFWTWKATFSFDDNLIGFTSVRVNSALPGQLQSFKELFVGRSFIYDRQKQELVELPDGNTNRFSFPEFTSDGNILVLQKGSGAESVGVIYKKD